MRRWFLNVIGSKLARRKPDPHLPAVDFRANIMDWLTVLAANADEQLKAAGLPEELRLTWEDCFHATDECNPMANEEGLARFTPAERVALIEFDDYMWSLPPHQDPMWDSDALDREPWPQVRAKAAELLHRLKNRGEIPAKPPQTSSS